MDNKDRRRYTNSYGFTLLEVLIAVIIMAIVSIPLVHSFASAARTSSRARLKMRATNAAENIMEDLKALTLEDIVKKYGNDGVTYPNTTGSNPAVTGDVAYEFTFKYPDDTGKVDSLNEDVKKILSTNKSGDNGNYQIKVKIDPSFYPKNNSINPSSYDMVSNDSSAIYNVTKAMDGQVYEIYKDLNAQLDDPYVLSPALLSSLGYTSTDDYFDKNVAREIRVDITSDGTFEDDETGETREYASVKVTVNYLLLQDSDFSAIEGYAVPKAAIAQTLASRTVFDNKDSKNALNSVILMYDPRYAAAGKNGDIIMVHNPDGVATNLYVIAQNTDSHYSKWRKYMTAAEGGLILDICEDKVDGKHPITLFTNLHDDVDYAKSDSYSADDAKNVLCYLNTFTNASSPEKMTDGFTAFIFNRIVYNSKGFFGKADTTNELRARDVDGKLLNLAGDDVDLNRIYDVTININYITPDTDLDPVEVEIAGTITN